MQIHTFTLIHTYKSAHIVEKFVIGVLLGF